jgi:hypothetical protein
MRIHSSRLLTLAAAFIAASTPAVMRGQAAAPPRDSAAAWPVSAGSRVGVRLPNVARSGLADALGGPQPSVVGTVERISGDTLYLRTHDALGLLPVPSAAVARLYVSGGRTRRPMMVIGFLFGALEGFWLSDLYYDARQTPWGSSRGASRRGFALLGASSGLLLGAFHPVEHWNRIR